jgi:release factor glutamine methyltransferase
MWAVDNLTRPFMSASLTIAAALRGATDTLRAANVADPQLISQSLLAEALGRDRTYLIVNFQEALPAETVTRFEELIARRIAGEPLQYIIGRQEFFGLEFEVTPAVLIPRPETELIVEEALHLAADIARPLIIDVGTGSGCLAVALARELPQAKVVAIDISPAAIRVASRNAMKHGLMSRIVFVVADLLSAVAAAPLADLIVSNPPYIGIEELPALQSEVRDWEPHTALTDGADGLSVYPRLFAEASARLKPGGYLLCEMGYQQAESIAALVDEEKWRAPRLLADLQGIHRTIVMQKKI